VLLMPFGMTAAVAAPHEPAAMAMEHCPDQPANSHGKSVFEQCTMACSAALPAAERPGDEPLLVVSAPLAPAITRALHGIMLEIATPPPKHS
jgi:hypothetical protein